MKNENSKRQKSILEDDTSIDSLFVLAETDEENARAVAAGISTQYRQNGIAEGAQRFLVTTSAVQYQDISKSKDGDYLSLKQWVRDEICLALGVPLTVLDVTQGASLNGAGSDNHLRKFVENTVRPFAVYIEAQLNKQLLSRWNAAGVNVLLKLVLEDTDDQTALEQTWDLCIRNGTMTPNEVRALRHMDPVQGGDTAFVTVGAAATPLDQLEAAAVASIDASHNHRLRRPSLPKRALL